MGADGCLVAGASGRRRVPALPTEIVDSTGAGDCWDAGFVAALATGEDVHTAALIGNAAASFCIRAVGGSAGVPLYAEVRRLAMSARP
jgi:2-dehydro-3-deoxygluconokinase